MLELSSIVDELRSQVRRLDAAIAALQGRGSTSHRSHSRGPANSHIARRGSKHRRTMSASTRLRLSKGMRARWAKAKKAGKTSL